MKKGQHTFSFGNYDEGYTKGKEAPGAYGSGERSSE